MINQLCDFNQRWGIFSFLHYFKSYQTEPKNYPVNCLSHIITLSLHTPSPHNGNKTYLTSFIPYRTNALDTSISVTYESKVSIGEQLENITWNQSHRCLAKYFTSVFFLMAFCYSPPESIGFSYYKRKASHLLPCLLNISHSLPALCLSPNNRHHEVVPDCITWRASEVTTASPHECSRIKRT